MSEKKQKKQKKPSQKPRKKVDIGTLLARKRKGTKITMITAYDAPTARMLDAAGIDTLLVGDSAANVVLGYADTIPVSMDEMVHHTKAVTRGNTYALVIGDMPFMSYNISREEAIRNAGRFMKEGGADAVKLEGGAQVADTVKEMVQAGIPVVGHLGLTPQTAGMIGGYKVQGRDAKTAKQIVKDAKKLEKAGAFMLVLECVPDRVATLISRSIKIPVIGIGAGNGCDGQVLVFHDMVGIKAGFTPKFVRRYAELQDAIVAAAEQYKADVESGDFPGPDETFPMDDKEFAKLKGKRR